MSKFKWAMKQLLPLGYFSEYGTGGRREVAVWRMWLGKCFAVRRWTVA